MRQICNIKLSLPEVQLALTLRDWWSCPDQARLRVWSSPSYRKTVLRIWRIGSAETTISRVEELFKAAGSEEILLWQEYERLFVGPAAPPCPPYEAVWRMDRPKQEEGTVIGQSTMEIQQLYLELGLQKQADEVELPDHIAIELEALAYALSCPGYDKLVDQILLKHLSAWLPQFCVSVGTCSRAAFYRELAEVTLAWVDSWHPRRLE